MKRHNVSTKIFAGWNAFEIAFLIVGLLTEIILFIVFKGLWYEFCYSILYFLTALLMAKRKIVCCFIGIISTVFYAAVAFFQKYYGEMIVAFLLTLPLMIVTLISWLKNKDDNNYDMVKPNRKRMHIELVFLIMSQLVMSIGYYFLLKYFKTESLALSVISVAVSFVASWLAMRRSHWMFIWYVINDCVLIMLWAQPLIKLDFSIIPIIFLQIMLLTNDCYGFIVWRQNVKADKIKVQTDNEAQE